MNYPCGIIRDLLPLYHDDVCSTETRNAVEKHCAGCTECRKILDDLGSLPEPCEMVKEAEKGNLTLRQKDMRKIRR